MSEIAIFVLFGVGLLIFFFGLLKFTWNISKTGIDIMEFFGNVGRPGTSREQSYNGKSKDSKVTWNKDGKKEI